MPAVRRPISNRSAPSPRPRRRRSRCWPAPRIGCSIPTPPSARLRRRPGVPAVQAGGGSLPGTGRRRSSRLARPGPHHRPAHQASARPIPLGRPARSFDAEVSALRGRDGTIQGVLVQLRDVTEAAARLRRAEAAAAVLDTIFEHAPVGLALAASPRAPGQAASGSAGMAWAWRGGNRRRSWPASARSAPPAGRSTTATA